AGVPVVPGSDGVIEDPDEVLALARETGFPVLIKAAAGGGGKGMRIAHNDVALKSAISMAAIEAETAFGDGGLYLEKFVEGARHIEFQILGDSSGKIITLGERECSIQRRHQKLIEETPSPGLSSSLRSRMAKAAIRGAKAIGYTNAGTAEFLLAPDGQFYFIEFNARIQVEHPITEEVTGVDLVKEQIRIASGEPMSKMNMRPSGHAIEARIYAEDPENGFSASPGIVPRCHLPGGPGIRVDSHLFAGYEVPRFYDSLLAKIIARGKDRDEAIDRLSAALLEFAADGIKTTARLCARIVSGDRFRRGDIGPDIIDQYVNGSM
ncbi:MAG TPA: ATP-grasp domain-containing protein, partial [Candidatus Hydrogenedentes bacterium]|nr:ATP-grasp domain-containing protein [Candidatus Hydrogenedentota bacterium]